jgi:hypothetical protein
MPLGCCYNILFFPLRRVRRGTTMGGLLSGPLPIQLILPESPMNWLSWLFRELLPRSFRLSRTCPGSPPSASPLAGCLILWGRLHYSFRLFWRKL